MSLIDRITQGLSTGLRVTLDQRQVEETLSPTQLGTDVYRCCTPSLCTDVDWGFDLEMGQWPPWAQQVREILLLSPKAADQLSLLMQGDVSSTRRDKLGI